MISLHRQEYGFSPTVNFSRMPAGYRKSSSYSLKLVREGKAYRGGPWKDVESHHAPGVPSAGDLKSKPISVSWCGHKWTKWQMLDSRTLSLSASAQGLYRIRDASSPGLLYIGQGILKGRLLSHFRKTLVGNSQQGAIFRTAKRLECSWVCADWLPNQREELECDLIASHLLVMGFVPLAQFIGESE